jgi:uncharacterized protein YjbJ (UPF0337 family)
MADEHRGEELKGRAKEAAGALSGDKDLKQEGRADQTSAKVKRGVDKAADKLNDAVDGLRDE